MSNRMLEVLPDKAAIAARALELVCEKICGAIADHDQCTLALAGGSTPKPLYEALAQRTDIDWTKLHVFWGDERYVSPDHPDSNEGMARRAWLDQVAIPAANIHPMPTTMPDPNMAATAHEQDLKQFFQLPPGQFPTLDIILLGMGDDGHTASLFPHTAALEVCDRWVTVGIKQSEPRLTFTIPLLNQANTVLFLVSGKNKTNALQQVLAPSTSNVDPRDVPARFINPQGELWWLLDQAAAPDGSSGWL